MTVTFKSLVEACRKAYDEKRLGAQQSFSVHAGWCLYVYTKGPDDCGCAIGVGLPPELRTELLNAEQNGSDLVGLFTHYSIGKDIRKDHVELLLDLQRSHDRWIGAHSTTKSDGESQFVKQLETCEAAVRHAELCDMPSGASVG